MFQRFAFAIVLVLLGPATAACAPEQPDVAEQTTATVPASTTPAEMTEATLPVQVDGTAEDFTPGLLAYFPKEVAAHPGDTVEFSLYNSGEPHTVTFGTVVEEAMAKLAELGPEQGMEAPEVQKLPVLIDEATLESDQSAAQPCYLASGEPGTDACAAGDQAQVDFDGTQSYYNSGWMTDAETFKVTLADDIQPGKYTYICLLHYPDMSGTITVVDADTKTPSADEVAAAGDMERQAMVDKLAPAVEQARAAMTKPDELQAGVLSPDVMNGLVAVFIPRETTVKAGEPVTWTVWGPHNIAFNVPEDASDIRVEDDTGVHVNMAIAAPAGGPGAPPPPTEDPNAPTPDPNAPTPDMSGPPPPPTLVDAGEWDGTGYHNSGIFVSFPPALYAYKLTFTKPGTYLYKCSVHPGMAGTVNVR